VLLLQKQQQYKHKFENKNEVTMMKRKFKQAYNSTIINKAKNHLSLQIIENKLDEVLTWDQQKEVEGLHQ